MTKAASLSLGLIILAGTAMTGWSQTTPTDTAINEAVRRQHATIKLQQLLGDARNAETSKDLVGAAKLYEQAYELVKSIGDPTTPEATATITGLVTVQLQLARAAQSRGDLLDAKARGARVLKVDPKNEAGIAFMKQNDKMIASQAGLIPSPPVVEQIPAIKKEKTDSLTLVQDGRLLLEMGKLDEAEAKLKEATQLDPSSTAAYYYMSLVKEAKYGEAERRRELSSKDAILKIEQDWVSKTKRDSLPVPNQYARSEQIYTSKGRQAIVAKLNRIHLDTVGPWDNLPLSEVVRILSDESRKRDPEKKGINFIVNSFLDAAAAPAGPLVTDPTTGLPVAPAGPAEAVDISSAAIKLNPPLNDVRLADVLDAILKVTDKPLKFSIEDYAIVFSFKGHETQPLFNRTFKVDPNTFYQGLEAVGAYEVPDLSSSSGGGGGGGGGSRGGGGGGSRGGGGGGQGGQGQGNLGIPRVYVAGSAGGGGGQSGGGGGGGGGGLKNVTRTNNTDEASVAVRNFFIALGVNLDPIQGKSVFFNERQGLLLVRATLQDLDTIEAAIQVLNVTPPQVNIKAKFAEITQEDSRALGFDWFVGNWTMNGGTIVGSAGTAPSLYGKPSTANPGGVFPGNLPAGTTIPPSGSDGLLTSGLRNSISAGGNTFNNPAVASVTGILTDPQFRVVIHALEQRSGVDLINAPELTTPSGRQAQIQVVDLRTIVTGTSLNQTSSGGGSDGGTSGTTSGGTGVGTTVDYPTTSLPFGSTLDVIPYVSADGFTIQMTIIPTLTEFLGYDDPGAFVPQAQSVGGNTLGVPITAQLPLPHIRLRQVTTSAIVWDGQTVVLGGLISENVVRLKDKVPVLGDLPLVGKLFRSEASSTAKKNLVIFVTPTIIDPAGNRWHSEDELPFMQNSIPAQRPVTPNP